MTSHACATCAAPLPNEARANKRYCSERCREKANEKRCIEPGCDKPHRARGYCVSHWNTHYRKKRKPRAYKCAVCGDTIYRTGINKHTKVCGGPCWYFHEYGQWPACDVPATHPSRSCPVPVDHPAHPRNREQRPSCRVFFPTCVTCGRVFATPYTVTTCSPECASAKRRSDRSEARHRRRARERGAFVSPVIRKEIFERDGWRCQLCGKKVKRDKVVPHPLAPTIDHIIPIADGGTHEPTNVQTAHFLCNSRKGTRGGGQLLLVG